jgi:hypothetical protein
MPALSRRRFFCACGAVALPAAASAQHPPAQPGLSPAQKKVIERDYGMRGGTADLKVRKALAYYTKHRLGLDLDPKARRPEDQHVVLVTGSGK